MKLNLFSLTFAFSIALTALSQSSALMAQSQSSEIWQQKDSGTHASLRGIHAVDAKVAWASGTEGTILRSTDGGEHWSKVATPDAETDGASLDFRGVEGFDENTAIAMASGPGEKSRLYKTEDGGKTWKLIFKNPDAPEGFFDAFWMDPLSGHGLLLGDPAKGHMVYFITDDEGATWTADHSQSFYIWKSSAFAASNSSIARGHRPASDNLGPETIAFDGFVTGGKAGTFLYEKWSTAPKFKTKGKLIPSFKKPIYSKSDANWNQFPLPLASGADSKGAFAIGMRYKAADCQDCSFGKAWYILAVGGDFEKPAETAGTAAWSDDGGKSWLSATKPPHGFRSAVEWSEKLGAWITVGTTGSDLSVDDGKNWQPLDDGKWNALSLPYAVGANGAIAKLNEEAAKEKIEAAKKELPAAAPAAPAAADSPVKAAMPESKDATQK